MSESSRIIGLTGGIGSGKSIVAKVFEILKVPVYNSDIRARQLMNQNVELKESIKQLLGKDSYLKNELNRSFVAQRIFNDNTLLEKMNQLVHPVVRKDVLLWKESFTNMSYLIQESALIYENNMEAYFDAIIVVSSPKALRIERISKRDGRPYKEIEKIIAKQLPEKLKQEKADHVVMNDEKALLLPQVIEIDQRLRLNLSA